MRPMTAGPRTRVGAILMWGVALAAAGMLAGVAAGSAAAATPTAAWAIQSLASPVDFSETLPACGRSCGDKYFLTAVNVGSRASTGAVIIKDTLPSGLQIAGGLKGEVKAEPAAGGPLIECKEVSSTSFECEDGVPVKPGGVLSVVVRVQVEAGTGPSSVTNVAEVAEVGGEHVTTSAPTTTANTLNESVPLFGFADLGSGALNEAGEPDLLAGDHPSAFVVTSDFTSEFEGGEGQGGGGRPVQEPKTIIVDLPLGFTGNALAAGQCTESVLYGDGRCPADSEVGTVALKNHEETQLLKVYNMVPEPDYPVEYAFELASTNVLLRPRVLPTDRGYVLSVTVPDIPRSKFVKLTGTTFTFFGDPAEQDGGGGSRAALFTNPTECTEGPLNTRMEMDSWVNPSRWVVQETPMYEGGPSQGVTGCEALQFNPTIGVSPETTQADTPSGYEVDVKVPQQPNVSPSLATPDLKNIEVTLPEGVAVSPGAADGLAGCQEKGPEGIDLGADDSIEKGYEAQEGEEIAADGLPHPAPGHCPAASQIGTVEVTTPILPGVLKGHVYQAQPKCGGEGESACTEEAAEKGEVFGLYLEVEGSGVIIKLAGSVSANPATGRLTTKFTNNPQFPFSEFKLHLNGGARAPLSNPQSCGTATTTSVVAPWSAPASGPAATPSSSFEVSGCGSAEPFSPSLVAQTEVPVAGALSPFTLRFSRQDGEQDLSGLTVTTPPGLLGMLSTVQQCPEPEASQGTCGAGSQIGHVKVAAGAGSDPFWTSGSVYLTGPYKGAPFGLSVVVPTVAGPFKLAGSNGQGDEVIRAAIQVNPASAVLTVTSDPFPQIVDGVPLRVQTVEVAIDRPGFMFNPTNCAEKTVTASLGGVLSNGSAGSTVAIDRPFAITNCASLPFKPSFTAATVGQASKAEGASLVVKVASKGGPGTSGEEANIKSVKVDLPKQLPSRLSTLQKACTEAKFNANPASCPEESDVGTATADTPVLANPLKGPAYLVSHGNEAFPDLEIVLQGEGITLVLDGNTQIKKGITSSTFKTVPDAPISSFELKLPIGKFSILGTDLPESAHYNLCGQTLNMPTAITGQNGAEIHDTTAISIAGCAKAKTLTRAQKLTKALKACKQDKKKAKRAKCEATARKDYGALKKAKKKGGKK